MNAQHRGHVPTSGTRQATRDLAGYRGPDDPGVVDHTAGLALVTCYLLAHANRGRQQRYAQLIAAHPEREFATLTDGQRALLRQLQAARDGLATRELDGWTEALSRFGALPATLQFFEPEAERWSGIRKTGIAECDQAQPSSRSICIRERATRFWIDLDSHNETGHCRHGMIGVLGVALSRRHQSRERCFFE